MMTNQRTQWYDRITRFKLTYGKYKTFCCSLILKVGLRKKRCGPRDEPLVSKDLKYAKNYSLFCNMPYFFFYTMFISTFKTKFQNSNKEGYKSLLFQVMCGL